MHKILMRKSLTNKIFNNINHQKMISVIFNILPVYNITIKKVKRNRYT